MAIRRLRLLFMTSTATHPSTSLQAPSIYQSIYPHPSMWLLPRATTINCCTLMKYSVSTLKIQHSQKQKKYQLILIPVPWQVRQYYLVITTIFRHILYNTKEKRQRKKKEKMSTHSSSWTVVFYCMFIVIS